MGNETDSSESDNKNGNDDTGKKCTEKIYDYVDQASDEVPSEEADGFVPLKRG